MPTEEKNQNKQYILHKWQTLNFQMRREMTHPNSVSKLGAEFGCEVECIRSFRITMVWIWLSQMSVWSTRLPESSYPKARGSDATIGLRGIWHYSKKPESTADEVGLVTKGHGKISSFSRTLRTVLVVIMQGLYY